MDLKKVQSGDKLKIPASTYNAFIDAAQAVKDKSNFLSSTNKNSDSRKVIVQNNSGGNLDKFEILGISAPYVTPTDNETDFQNRITIVGITPDIDDHKGKFIVLQEPIPNGKIGRGIISGETIVKINVVDEDHKYADVTDATSTYLTSSDSGSARILWKESGTGVVWAYVRIGNNVSILFGTVASPPSSGEAEVTLQKVNDDGSKTSLDITITGVIPEE
ncbi:MAG: hypothetical protein EOM87_07220 [Clostridia bacterium]|nr:hypothetical protein [Clostridia bacterium]